MYLCCPTPRALIFGSITADPFEVLGVRLSGRYYPNSALLVAGSRYGLQGSQSLEQPPRMPAEGAWDKRPGGCPRPTMFLLWGFGDLLAIQRALAALKGHRSFDSSSKPCEGADSSASKRLLNSNLGLPPKHLHSNCPAASQDAEHTRAQRCAPTRRWGRPARNLRGVVQNEQPLQGVTVFL